MIAVTQSLFSSQNELATSAAMGREVRGRAVLLDAMGTLLTFGDPTPRLRAALVERLGVDVGEAAARAAIRAEIAHYRAHLHLGRDAATLAALRAACAEAMRPALGLAAADAPLPALTAALLDALSFSAYADSAPALRALRADGWARVVVSNWDASLHERLAETGLAGLVDGAVASAELGAAKPDGAIFARALALAGAEAADAWHVGDSVEADVEGALAAGIRPVLICRKGAPPPLDGVPVIRGLDALPPLIAGT
jgi:putative hydrolase of the HAD superfamily